MGASAHQADAFNEDAQFFFKTAAIAEIVGVSEMMISKYVKAGMPKESRGTFDVRKVFEWLDQQRNTRQRSDSEATSQSELNKARRQKIELELAEQYGRLVPIDQVRTLLHTIATQVAGQLDSLAPRVAPNVAPLDDPAQVQDLIFTEARAIREAIAGEWVAFARTLGAEGRAALGEPGEEPPPPKRKRQRRKASA